MYWPILANASGEKMDETNQIYARLLLIKGREFPGSTNYQWTIRGEPTSDQKSILDKYCSWREEFSAWFYYQEALPPEIQEIVQIQESQVETANGYSSLKSNSTASPTPSDSMPSATFPAPG